MGDFVIIKSTSRGKAYIDGKEIIRKADINPLIGDRIASMTKAVGIQPCGGCTKRQKWFNDKHEKWRERMKPKTEEV